MRTTSHGHHFKRPQSEATPADHLEDSKGSVGSVGSGIGIKRAYERSDPKDGRRVLVDRLWPRGLS
jgi:hypothetical protein